MSTTKRIKPGIYCRGPYQYQVKIRRNGESVSATFETLAEAEKFHKVQLGKVIAHEFVDTSKERRTSLRSILERYMAEITPTKRGARQEANRLKAWMRTDMAAYSIAAIEPKDIADWIADQKGKAPSTISNSVNLLSAVFKKAREWGYRVDNPCQPWHWPRNVAMSLRSSELSSTAPVQPVVMSDTIPAFDILRTDGSVRGRAMLMSHPLDGFATAVAGTSLGLTLSV